MNIRCLPLWRGLQRGGLAGALAGGMEDRIATATDRTAKGVEGLRQNVRNSKAAFV